jgi:hypothetical protein
MLNHLDRRTFLQASAAGVAATSVAGLRAEEKEKLLRGTADSCIFLWLGGGACQIDTFDPKRKGDGKKVAGSYYDPIDTAVPGVQVCQHLPQMAKLMERCVVVRSVNHDVIDEHGAATNRVHTGRAPTGTTAYPSIGSIIAHERGAAGDGVPPYVLIGYPSNSRGSGFLGAKHSYVYLTDTEAGPAGLSRPDGVPPQRQSRREALLAATREEYLQRQGKDVRLAQYAASSEAGLALMGPQFMNVFDLKTESDALRQSYGGEFGQRCLLARRLVESGVRFVEVSFNLNFINGTGWDTHNAGQLNQHLLIKELDQAMAGLLTDLEERKRLDKTLVVIATEFGRPPEFDGGGGRGHQGSAFSMVLAGGGLKTGQAIGTTDEIGKKVVDRPVSVPDFHATIHAALGIDPAKELYDGERPVPITDHGQPIEELFV